MTGTDNGKSPPMPDLPHVQTVSVVDMAREEVEESIPDSAGCFHIETHDSKLIVVKLEYDFKLKSSKFSIKEEAVADVQTESIAKKLE